MESNARAWIAALRHSHEALLGLVGPLGPGQLSGPSYCGDWTIAQVLSHLGSGAEIAMMRLPSALGQGDPADPATFQAVWDRWNAMTPDEQAAAGIMTDAQYVQALDQLSDDELASISAELFGMTMDAVSLIRLRLAEHALHTWDVAVIADPAAVIAREASDLLIDAVPRLFAPHAGKPAGQPFRARIKTTDPDRDYLLTADDSVAVADWPADGAPPEGPEIADVTMPAESLLRLVCGRLDAAHTPAGVTAKPDDLDRLRAVFPGF